jgi:hypothetical protein
MQERRDATAEGHVVAVRHGRPMHMDARLVRRPPPEPAFGRGHVPRNHVYFVTALYQTARELERAMSTWLIGCDEILMEIGDLHAADMNGSDRRSMARTLAREDWRLLGGFAACPDTFVSGASCADA